jgi:multidrug efflux pump subunit AcrA (membrane-fusion protein)
MSQSRRIPRAFLAGTPLRRALIGGGLSSLALVLVLVAGCHRTLPPPENTVSTMPTIHVIRPEVRDLSCTVDQPGFVEAYEQTAIFSKVSGFIKKLYVDIGQQVKKDDLLAEVFVPELQEEHQQKMAQVELAKRQVEQAQQMVVVAQSKLQTAIAEVGEAKATLGKYRAETARWESEVRRMTQMVQARVVDKQALDETQEQLGSSKSALDAGQAVVTAREAAQISAEADVGKAKIDVETSKAQVRVAEAEERRTAAMLAYTKVTAPYDGIVTIRNANTGDYVQAASGDKTSGNGGPLFIVARDDLVRIFVDVPETYARYVQGTGSRRSPQRSGHRHDRHSHLMEPPREDPGAPGRDRPCRKRLRRLASRDVCLHQSPGGAAQGTGDPPGGPRGYRQPDLLLPPGKWPCGEDACLARPSRRKMGRGRQNESGRSLGQGHRPRGRDPRRLGRAHGDQHDVDCGLMT